jgi:hypothetical protein
MADDMSRTGCDGLNMGWSADAWTIAAAWRLGAERWLQQHGLIALSRCAHVSNSYYGSDRWMLVPGAPFCGHLGDVFPFLVAAVDRLMNRKERDFRILTRGIVFEGLQRDT